MQGEGAEKRVHPSERCAASLLPEQSSGQMWVLLECLRVRTERIPVGLVQQRDEVLNTLQKAQADLLTREEEGIQPCSSVPSPCPPTNVSALAETVKEFEVTCMDWAQDPESAPKDSGAKQYVRDWFAEKDMVVEEIQSIGARRCAGAEANSQTGCHRFLPYALYKTGVSRCPTCMRSLRAAVAALANRCLQDERAECQDPQETGHSCEAKEEIESPLVAGVGCSGTAVLEKHVSFDDTAEWKIECEQKLAFAIYAGMPNIYYLALVLPTDVVEAKATGGSLMVTWLDGDSDHRSVPADEVIFLDSPLAAEVRNEATAFWDVDVARLAPHATGP